MPAQISESPIGTVGTGTTVSVSASAWTKVPAAGNRSSRSGILVSVPSTNTANMVGVLSTSSSSPTEATSVRPLEFAKTAGFIFVPASSNVYLYLITLNATAENVHVQEVTQGV